MVLGLLGLRLAQLPIITSITIHYVLMMVARIIDLPIVMFMAVVRLYHHQYHTVAACGHGSIIVILLLYFYLFDCGYRPIWSFPCCKQKTGSLIIRPPLFVVSNHIPVCGMVDSWIASRLKLPRSEVGWWCPDWAVEFSHGPLTQVVKYICPSPTVWSWRIWLWSRWVSYLLSWLAVLTLAIPWWEMEFGRLAWHMDIAQIISPIDACWRSPLISGLVQLIWLAFGWLLWDLQRFCCPTCGCFSFFGEISVP